MNPFMRHLASPSARVGRRGMFMREISMRKQFAILLELSLQRSTARSTMPDFTSNTTCQLHVYDAMGNCRECGNMAVSIWKARDGDLAVCEQFVGGETFEPLPAAS